MNSIKKLIGTLLFTLFLNFTYGCSTPSGINLSHITTTSATISWGGVSGATQYKLLYRKIGTSTWTNLSVYTTTKTLNGLIPATQYQFKLKAICGLTQSLFSAVDTLKTLLTFNVPVPDHVVVFILENHGYPDIIGAAAAPHINALVNDSMSALFTQSYGITHPSQPNYLHLYSGSNQGVLDNAKPDSIPFTTANLGRQLIDAGKTFITFSQTLPSVGYNGIKSGAYARKHNPVANWMGNGSNRVSPTCNQPFTAFPATNFASLPTVCFVIPDQDNDMHNGVHPTNITNGDNWFYTNMNNYIQWAKTHNSLFILTFDEDNGIYNNRIATIFNGSMVMHGSYSNHIDHYSILRTIEDMYGLPYAANAASSTPITNCWKTTPRIDSIAAENTGDFNLEVFPNPASATLNIIADQSLLDENQLVIYDLTGKKIFQKLNISKSEVLDISSFAKGNYFLKLISGSKSVTQKFEKE